MEHVLKGAVMARSYGEGHGLYTTYVWCNVSEQFSLDWWRKQGYAFVCEANIPYTPFTSEQAVNEEIATLRAQQAAKRAEVERECIEISARIGRLLQLEYMPSENQVSEETRASCYSNGDVTDI